jgi:hypothetical protein
MAAQRLPLMSDPHISRLTLGGIHLVIVEGDLWTAGHREVFTSRLTRGVAPVFVTLGTRFTRRPAHRSTKHHPRRLRLSRPCGRAATWNRVA